ncbi:MAG: metallophosphoesterase [Clostridium sp.]|uniref:metallophosphoesterase n=1 Tax=Clostridium sp. TaxID=1506 RepID=UPI003EE764B7
MIIDAYITKNKNGFDVPFDNYLRNMTDEQLRELFEKGKFPQNEDFMAIIDSKMNKNDTFDKETMIDLLEAYFHHNPEIASEWMAAERDRRGNEVIRQKNEVKREEDFACIKECADNKMAEMEQTIVDTNAAKDNMISAVNSKLTETDAKIKEADNKIVDVENRFNTKANEVEDRMLSVENRADSKISEMEVAKVDMTTKVEQKIVDVESRFEDLMVTDGIGEVIMSRSSMDGVVHDHLPARLRHDFNKIDSSAIIGGFHQVTTIAERDSIPQDKRKLGMFCYVKNEDFTYQLKEKDGVEFWEEFSSGTGGMVVETIADIDNIPENKLFVGLEVFVVETMFKYTYKGQGVWERTSINSVHIGNTPPVDKTSLWIDDEDENVDSYWDSDILTEIRTGIKNANDKANEVHYALTHEIDSGYFNDTLPNDSGNEIITFNEEEGYVPNLDNGAKGTCERIILKRGLKSDIEALHEAELGFCIDTEELYVGNKGTLKLLAKVGGVGGGSGNGNVTGEYVELIASNGERYRVRVNNDGDLYTYNSVADTANNPTYDQAPLYKGLIINHCYGGGNRNANVAICSHGFIELYNNSDNTINLKGLSLQYGELGKDWQAFELKGMVKPYTSFLVRCAEHTDINRKTCRFKIKNYDMHWDIPLSNNGFKVYLGIGGDVLTVKNPANIDNLWTKQQGYIDLFAFGSINPALGIDAYEKSGNADGYIRAGSMLNSVHRIDFKDTDSSFLDLESVNLKTADVKTYTPRCSKDGQWNTYYNKLKLYDHKPNMINMCFGKDGNTTRTFTWQSSVTHNGCLKYKKKGAVDYITVDSEKEIAWHYDTDSTVHRVIIRNLVPGTYVYKCGEEGKWSDEYEFEVKVPTENDAIKMLLTSDQQGINEEEYHVWRKANDVICQNETFDFHINTGDISNDGGEFGFQWRYYYDYAKEHLCSIPHMTTCGNNDLTPNDKDKKKTDPTAFQWYATYEDSHIPSCYSWNYGYIHFVCLNSNTLQASDIVEQQLPWLREDLAKPENQKRWTIVYMHESPYTIIKQAKMAKFIDVFAEFGVDLVLCGHHHRYSRSNRMGMQGANGQDVIDNENGCYYVMCQATGYKLMGKTAPAADNDAPFRATWSAPGNPMYIMWDITHESIAMRPYTIANILPETDNDFNEPELIPYDDSLVITKV